MREIKFRAWDDQQKEWIADRDLYMMTNGRVYAGDMDNPPIVHIKQEWVSFSTGLRDAYGKEIYEGDFIEIKMVDDVETFEVYYSPERARFSIRDCGGFGYGFDDSNDMRVIGNIYEDPELLGVRP